MNQPQDALDEAIVVVRVALAEYSSVALSSSIHRALRVARMLGDAENVWWLDWEMRDLSDSHSRQDVLSEVKVAIAPERQAVLMSEYLSRYEHERSVWNTIDISKVAPQTKGLLIQDSVETIERRIRLSSELQPALKWYDVLFNRPQLGKQQIELTLTGSHLGGVLERISTRVYAYLSRIEAASAFSQSAIGLLSPHVKQVNALLQNVAPTVLDMMTSVYRRLQEGDQEALSQAALSCRRVLKAIADLVHPPTTKMLRGSDGLDHPLDDASFLNRLIAYVQSSFGERMSGLEVAAINDLARRLGALNDLASKGVHIDALTLFEARQCALQTYVVAGDVLAQHHLAREPIS